MKKYKKIVPIIIAFIIGIGTTVTAATVFNSKDITYSSSATTKTNVKDSLDELYTKVGKCPEGYECLKLQGLASKVEKGAYIKMTPTSTSYTISKDLTGYSSDQTINPSELNLWRVIRKNEDGTIDVVSEYASSKDIYFKGKTGYLNLVGILNQIAAQYTNVSYVENTRNMGFKYQITTCSSLEETKCSDDNGYLLDTEIVKEVLNSLNALKVVQRYPAEYWLSSRYSYYIGRQKKFDGRYVYQEEVNKSTLYDTTTNPYEEKTQGHAIRPILTLKSDIQIKSGDGKSGSTAFQFN